MKIVVKLFIEFRYKYLHINQKIENRYIRGGISFHMSSTLFCNGTPPLMIIYTHVFLDPEHFVKGSYNIAFFFRRRVTLLLPMLLVVYT